MKYFYFLIFVILASSANALLVNDIIDFEACGNIQGRWTSTGETTELFQDRLILTKHICQSTGSVRWCARTILNRCYYINHYDTSLGERIFSRERRIWIDRDIVIDSTAYPTMRYLGRNEEWAYLGITGQQSLEITCPDCKLEDRFIVTTDCTQESFINSCKAIYFPVEVIKETGEEKQLTIKHISKDIFKANWSGELDPVITEVITSTACNYPHICNQVVWNGKGLQMYVNSTFSQDLWAFYVFEEGSGTSVEDLAGGDNDIVLDATNGPRWYNNDLSCYQGTSCLWNSSSKSDTTYIANSINLNFSQMSLMFYTNLSVDGDSNDHFASGNNNIFNGRWTSSNSLTCNIGGTVVFANSDFQIRNNTWIGCHWNSTTVKASIDSVFRGSSGKTGSIQAASQTIKFMNDYFSNGRYQGYVDTWLWWANSSLDSAKLSALKNGIYPTEANFTLNFSSSDTNNRANISFNCKNTDSQSSCCAMIDGEASPAWHCSNTTNVQLISGTNRNVTIKFNTTNPKKTPILINVKIDTWNEGACTESLTNTSWSAWQNMTGCQITDTFSQNRSRTTYDANNCGTFANITHWEINTTDPCNYCSYSLTNTSWSAWQNTSDCISDTYTQNRSRETYDANYLTCYAVTGLASDLWNSGVNITFWETQNLNCDSCTESLSNTSWSAWQNMTDCILNLVQQNRSQVTYDLNVCGTFTNVTFWEFQNSSCEICLPSWSCTNYTSCNMTDLHWCLNVTDLNNCGESYSGNYSEFNTKCSYCSENSDIDICEVKKMWYIAAAIIFMSIMAIFIYIGKTWDFNISDTRQKINVMRLFITWTLFWLCPLLISMVSEMGVAESASADLLTLIDTLYHVDFIFNLVVSAYFLLYLFINLLQFFNVDVFNTFKRGQK